MKLSVLPLWYEARDMAGGRAFVLWDTSNLTAALVRADASAFAASLGGDSPRRVVYALTHITLESLGGRNNLSPGESQVLPAGAPHRIGASAREGSWALEVSWGRRAYGALLSSEPGIGVVPATFHYRIQETPWGWGYVLFGSPPVTVKILRVDPGMRLSLQFHERRDERWVFLTDGAGVIGEEEMRWRAGEEVFVPRLTRHRLGSRENTEVVVLEVSTGNVDEADIVRIADDHGRV